MYGFLIGILTGILSGLGIGGGTILIPALTIFLKIEQHAAQSINLISFIPSAIIALIVHYKNGNLEKGLLKKLIIPGIIAALIGSFISLKLGSDLLKKIFALFLFIMGLFEIVSIRILDKS